MDGLIDIPYPGHLRRDNVCRELSTPGGYVLAPFRMAGIAAGDLGVVSSCHKSCSLPTPPPKKDQNSIAPKNGHALATYVPVLYIKSAACGHNKLPIRSVLIQNFPFALCVNSNLPLGSET